MKLVIIFGPPAVGKMTVGRELAKITGLKLLHNHMSLELVNQFFDFGTPPLRRLDKLIRFGIFKEVAKSDLPGLIFTFVWALNEQEDEDYVNEIAAIFENEGAEVCYVELYTPLEQRLIRNKQPDRIAAKPSKRDLEMSESNLLYTEKTYRMNSHEGELSERAWLKIDNTDLSPEVVAEKIKAYFGL